MKTPEQLRKYLIDGKKRNDEIKEFKMRKYRAMSKCKVGICKEYQRTKDMINYGFDSDHLRFVLWYEKRNAHRIRLKSDLV